MKKILTLFTLSLAALSLRAEVVILTVNMGELYNKYHRAQEAQTKFNSEVEKAQDEIRQMIDEGRQLASSLQEAIAKANNPALTDSAKQSASKEAEDLQMQIRRKEIEVNNFKQQTDQILAARRQSAMNLSLDEIKQAIEQVAKKYNADLVLNSDGISLVYSDPSKDVTQPVLQVLNANK